MGSFYSTCSITHMTLKNQKTSIQLLVPSYCTDLNAHKGMIVSNEGSQAFFSVFGFPINGKYDDYGHIREIERDKNVEMLEDFFNLRIETLLDNIGDDRWLRYGEERNDNYWKIKTKDGGPIKNKEIYLSLAKTYFRTEIMESFYGKYTSSMLKELLKTLRNMKEDKEKLKELIPNNEELEKEELNKTLLQISKKISTTLQNKKDENGQELNEEEVNSLKEELNMVCKFIIGHDEINLRYTSYIPSLTEINMFKVLPINEEFEKEIQNQYSLILALSVLRRSLMPSDYGGQQDNYSELVKLNELANELMLKDFMEEMSYEFEHYYLEDEKRFIEDYGERAKRYLKLRKKKKK